MPFEHLLTKIYIALFPKVWYINALLQNALKDTPATPQPAPGFTHTPSRNVFSGFRSFRFRLSITPEITFQILKVPPK